MGWRENNFFVIAKFIYDYMPDTNVIYAETDANGKKEYFGKKVIQMRGFKLPERKNLRISFLYSLN